MSKTILFCEISLFVDGSANTQPPREQLVDLVISHNFPFSLSFWDFFFFFTKAISIDAVSIVVDI